MDPLSGQDQAPPVSMPGPDPSVQANLAGGDNNTVNPVATATPAPPPPGSLWKSVVAGALAGLAHSAGQKHFGGGLGAGAEGSAELNQQKVENKQHQAQTQSTIQFQSAQAANLASEAMLRQRQADNADAETRNKLDESNRQNSQLLINSYGNPSMVVPYDPSDHEDKAAHAAMSSLAQQNGGTVPPVVTSHVGNNILIWDMNQMSKNDSSSLGQVNDYLRMNNRPPIAQADWSNKTKYPDAAKTQMIENASKFYQVSPSHDPVELGLEAERLKQAVASAPKDADPAKIALLKHNADVTETLHQKAMTDAKTLAGAKAGAVQGATEPTKQQDKGKDEISKVWTDPSKGFASALQQGNQTIESIKAGENGNGLLTSLAPTMEILGVNHAAGISRISPAEAAAANLPGGFAERWNAWSTKAATDKLSPQLASEGRQLMNIVLDAAHSRAVQSSRFIAKNRGLDPSQAAAMDRNGNLTTLDKVGSASSSGARPGERAVRDPKTRQVIGFTTDGKTMRKAE